MQIIPAIDLINGRCVRLTQGDYARVTQYPSDPVAMAQAFVADGAETVHIVDLDGAKEGRPINAELIFRIADAAIVPLQVGGGIRTTVDAVNYLQRGVQRVLLGTVAFEDPNVVATIVQQFGADRVVVALDHRQGQILFRGWQAPAPLMLEDGVEWLTDSSVQWVLLTDVASDGGLGSISRNQVEAVRQYAAAKVHVIAAGGVTTTDDIVRLRKAGAKAAIVGKALYEGRITLSAAIAAAKGGDTA